MQSDVTVTGVSQCEARFAVREAGALALQTTAFPAIAADFHRMQAARFDSNGAGTWAPLSLTTIAIKTRRNLPDPTRTLYGQGDLVNSLTGFTEHTVYEATPEELVIGTKVRYAQYHQRGPRQIRIFGRGSGTLPERRLVDLTEMDAARWAQIVRLALNDPGIVIAAGAVA